MVNAVRVHNYGDPSVLVWEKVDVGAPGVGQVRIKHLAVGLNYIDTYHRSGLYPLETLPAILGLEAAGEIIAVGPEVDGLSIGDRVAYTDQLGAYAEERLVEADRLVKIPDGIDVLTAAAMMLQGLTVHYLLKKTFQVGPQTTLLFHAAAGGVGLIACQWAKYLGATIIGTVSSDEKGEIAKAHGCTHVINTKRDDFVARVKDITDGHGCDVVYDGIGKDTFPASLDCLKTFGLWVTFGNASGPIKAFDIGLLGKKGSLFATRPSLFHHIASREDLTCSAADLFDVVAKGIVKISVNQNYPLRDAAKAHADLEARATTGSTVLLP